MNRIVLEISEEGIATVRMQDRAGNNAFSPAFIEEFLQTLKRLDDESIKVCVFCGLDDVFCSGGDEEVLLGLAQGTAKSYDLKMVKNILEIPVPTIAAMEGHATGGGLVLGLCCDMVIMAEESSYGCPFMNLGFTPGMGTTGLLRYAMGEYFAAEMMFGGQYFRGSRFRERTLVNYIEPKARVMERARTLALRIAVKPRPALIMLKQNLSLPRAKAVDEACTAEAIMHEACFRDPETVNRIKENFLKHD
ncbi:MAG: enoyl-CoA hydratase [Nitrospinae bacterium CG11_big_fil_rev_8_21_14_0_20_56_8]|nr:MAG: enoyl-CoA hydratase [Nitrospinae bacterium CG11_big_fil_rev_8_21_14_0_20_56_8]